MTKYYFRLLLLLATIFGIFALIGSLLPRGYSISSEILIDAPPQAVFAEINDLENWQSWSPWSPERIEGLTVRCIGTSGVGNAMTWNDARGEGKLWIITSEPACKIEYLMRFSNFPEMTSDITLTPTDNATKVQWSSQGRLPSGPFYGYLAPFFGYHMRHEYDESLIRLKDKLEEGLDP